MHLGNFSWMECDGEECNRYLQERLEKLTQCIDGTGVACENFGPLAVQN